MAVVEQALSGAFQGQMVEPRLGADVGVILLGGSSGAVPVERAKLIARLGCRVMALRWFGGQGQSPGICEIPLEQFQGAVDALVKAGCGRIAIIGTSKGAEAALLTATRDDRIRLTMAFSPTSVVWANVGPGLDGFEWPLRSSFAWRGEGLPFAPHAAEALLSLNRRPPVRYLEFFESSLAQFPEAAAAAAIPVERMSGEAILVAGGDDHLWPSLAFAEALAERGVRMGKPIALLTHPEAGHRILLPGEPALASKVNEHGGSDAADAALGALAWEALTAWVS
jgi:acetyl esterase/lipase